MQFLSIIWQLIKSLPALLQLLESARRFFIDRKKQNKEEKNEEITKEAEDAKTPEERQQAVDNVAARWGNK